MHKEFNQIEKNQTWELILRPHNKNVIGTKWVFRNKLNENWEVIWNKATLVWKIYGQQKDIDFEETFACVARLEAIIIFLAFSIFHKFKVYQMMLNLDF